MTDSYNQQNINTIGFNADAGNVIANGAIGDGIFDNYTVLQNLIDRLSNAGGGKLYFPAGTYYCSRQLDLKDGVEIDGDGPSSSIITFENAPIANFSEACIYASGSLTQTADLSANPNEGDDAITLTDASVFSEGSIGCIYNPADNSFSPSRTYYHAGEWFRVVSISGNTLTLDAPLFAGYTAANVDIYIMTPVKTGVRNVQIRGVGESSIRVLDAELCSNSSFQNLQMSGSGRSHLSIRRSFEIEMNDIQIFEHQPDIGLNYGIAIGNSQRVAISNCIISTTRHCVSHGGGADIGSVPCRDSITNDCELYSDESLSWDCHGNSEFISVQNSVLIGAALGGDNINVEGCFIRGNVDGGVAITMNELIGINIVIKNNRIWADEDVLSSRGLIQWDEPETATEFLTRSDGVMQVINNEIAMGPFDGHPLLIRKRMSESDVNLVVRGNIITKDVQVAGEGECLLAGYNAGGAASYWNTVVCSDNQLVNCGLKILDTCAQVCTIENNTVRMAPVNGIRYEGHISIPWNTETVSIVGNVVEGALQTGIYFFGSDQTLTNVFCSNNVSIRNNLSGAAASPKDEASFYFLTAKNAVFRNNLCGDDQAVPTQTRAWEANSITLFEQESNSIIGSVTTVGRTSITKEIAHVNDDPTRTTSYGTAPPAAGTWVQGDIRWNTAPAAGGTPGWVCTTGGTPGTWKAMASVAV